MPLGSKRNNNLQRITLDVWQDSGFLSEQAYPAGYFPAYESGSGSPSVPDPFRRPHRPRDGSTQASGSGPVGLFRRTG